MKTTGWKVIYTLLFLITSLILLFMSINKGITIFTILLMISLSLTALGSFLIGKITYYGHLIDDPVLIDHGKDLEISFIDSESGIIELQWDDYEARFLKVVPESIIDLKLGDILSKENPEDEGFILINQDK